MPRLHYVTGIPDHPAEMAYLPHVNGKHGWNRNTHRRMITAADPIFIERLWYVPVINGRNTFGNVWMYSGVTGKHKATHLSLVQFLLIQRRQIYLLCLAGISPPVLDSHLELRRHGILAPYGKPGILCVQILCLHLFPCPFFRLF